MYICLGVRPLGPWTLVSFDYRGFPLARFASSLTHQSGPVYYVTVAAIDLMDRL